MNTFATNNQLPIQTPVYRVGQVQSPSQERPDTDDARRETQPRPDSQPSDYVFKGELIDSIADEKRYRPRYSQDISPQNKPAIASYQNSQYRLDESDARGQLLDQFV